MSIVEPVNSSAFHDAFRRMGRTENFSYEARELLFEYLEQYSEDSGEPLELDVIAICCDYNELSAAEVASEYSNCSAPQLEDFEGDTDVHADAVEAWLSEQTSLVGRTADDTFVFAGF